MHFVCGKRIYFLEPMCSKIEAEVSRMSSFIPKNYQKEAITIRIPAELLGQIDQLALEFQISRSALINQCLTYAIDNLPADLEKSDQK